MTEWMKRSERYAFLGRSILLHAVAVAAPAGALLILGHSGAGKSTLAGQLAARFPLLADDHVLAVKSRDDGRWHIADAKTIRTTGWRWTPLLAAIRTFQAARAGMTPLASHELARYFLDAAYETGMLPAAPVRLKKAAFACCADMAESCRGWRLEATLQPATAELVWDCVSRMDMDDNEIERGQACLKKNM